jgi:chromosome segregation ATPase
LNKKIEEYEENLMNMDNENKKLNEEIKKLNKTMEEIKNGKNEENNSIEQLRDEKEKLNTEIDLLKNKLQEAESLNSTKDNDYKNKTLKMENDIKSLEGKIQEKDNEIKNYIDKIAQLEELNKTNGQVKNNESDEKIKELEKKNKELNDTITNLEKETKELNNKNKNLMQEKEKLMKEKQNLEKDNKSLKKNVMQSTIKLENSINDRQIQKSNIMQSQIFMEDDTQKVNNKSISPFNNLNGMSLKGSIMPFGNFGEIKEEENEDFNSNNPSKKTSTNANLRTSDFVFTGNYIDDDEDNNNEPKKDDIKESNIFGKSNTNKLKKSSVLGMSLNNNLFEFNNNNSPYDENYVGELKDEINQLYKNRDKLEDEILIKDEKLKKSMMDIDELRKIIEQKDKDIEELKKK